MKKVLTFTTSLICISIVMFVVFTKANYSNLTKEEALRIGEEKYLEFLWMVDGAFNNERYKSEFIVNGKKMDKEKIKFTCNYKKKNDISCVGNNFLEEFERLFASNITYNDVYSDGILYTWYEYKKDNYIFTNSNSCNISRMNLKQKISVHKIENNKLIFDVSIENEDYSNNQVRTFILIKENSLWKISKAYYEDLCEIKYRIG